MAHTLDAARLLIGGALLLYASVRDLKERRVENGVWLLGSLLGGLLLILDYFVMGRLQPYHLLIVLLVVAAAYGLWYLRLLAGGADAKALMMLAVLLPAPVAWDLAGRTFPLWPSVVPSALVVLANGVLAFVVAPVAFLAYNAARGDFAFPAMLLGTRMPLDLAEERHVWVMERALPGGRTKQLVWASRSSAEEDLANVRRLRSQGRTRVWTTPKIPFMVPLFAAFVAAFFLGDVLTRLIVEFVLPLVR